MSPWIALVGLISLLAAWATNVEVQRRSVAKGDGLLRMWCKGGFAGGLAMLVVWALFFLAGSLVQVLRA